ncbi:TlyA family RNA methyltransferase [Bacilliculturomica massiliensis]|uniref:TlyA family RNA methyltransferase n=1 Tax=Bacilliculturomica massiliensis TaxID=1917867 RepID=UPI00102FF0D0|nr:TlyA family RNA methyltransferase [Bacilliculturomica massiliensis]
MKERLDILLVNRGFFPSREKAKAAVMARQVTVDGVMVDKAGTGVSEDSVLAVKENTCPYVSRGGLKLAKALSAFSFSLTDAVCMDIGASTGGFTDCMLQNGASKVYAVDVGYGQLDWKLRNDSRVVNMEKVNIRYLDRDKIREELDFISIDVSFISLKLVFPVAAALLRRGGELICLVKPQFEAGREQVGKNGIVRDKNIHGQVLLHVREYAEENGLAVKGITWSPVKGAKGNIEYLMYLKKTPGAQVGPGAADETENGIETEEAEAARGKEAVTDREQIDSLIGRVVAESHAELDK